MEIKTGLELDVCMKLFKHVCLIVTSKNRGLESLLCVMSRLQLAGRGGQQEMIGLKTKEIFKLHTTPADPIVVVRKIHTCPDLLPVAVTTADTDQANFDTSSHPLLSSAWNSKSTTSLKHSYKLHNGKKTKKKSHLLSQL